MVYQNEIERYICDWNAYALLDSGNGERLERLGSFVLRRQDPRAWWKPDLSEDEWRKADATFVEQREERGRWHFNRPLPEVWSVSFAGVSVEARFTDMSKHIGVFPEHAPHWGLLAARIRDFGKGFRLLNLFGYTGVASLVAASVGATVTHVDASPKAVEWGKSSQKRAGLGEKPIRWLVDDAYKFALREGRRGRIYDGILLDPPKYGRGPKGEIWKVEQGLPPLLDACKTLLNPENGFLLLTMYATDDTASTAGNLLYDLLKDRPGKLRMGELILPHTSSPKQLSVSICGIWEGGMKKIGERA
ncbi:MAG: RsmD family RNA methyltransferase [Bacteroidetes Order II. Incertae sedis bacterium]|nr:RsmD family RNA methyltransferase [Bacteroidetes Order II. bacterium]